MRATSGLHTETKTLSPNSLPRNRRNGREGIASPHRSTRCSPPRLTFIFYRTSDYSWPPNSRYVTICNGSLIERSMKTTSRLLRLIFFAVMALPFRAYAAAPPTCTARCDSMPGSQLFCPCVLDVSACSCQAGSRETVCTLDFSKKPSPQMIREAGLGPLCVPQCGGVLCSKDMFDCAGLCAAVNPYQMCEGPINSGSRCITVAPNPTETYGSTVGLSQSSEGIELCCPNPNEVIIGCTVTTSPPHGYGQCEPLSIGGGLGCQAQWICRCPGIEIQCGPPDNTCPAPSTQCGENDCCEEGIPCIDGTCCTTPQTPCTETGVPVCCPEGMGCSATGGCCERCPTVCCPPGRSCLNGICSPCSAGQQECPGPNQSTLCCPTGSICTAGACCPNLRYCPGATPQCCPEGSICENGTTCSTSQSRKVFIRQ